MDEHGLARTLGWVSVGAGLALVAAPGPLMKAFGLGDRPNLGRFLGVRDLVLGTGRPSASRSTSKPTYSQPADSGVTFTTLPFVSGSFLLLRIRSATFFDAPP
jgi:hypothetical protein